MGKREIKSKTGTAVALILFQSMLYGFGDAISKAAFEIMPVYSLITARYAIAFVLLILIYHKTLLKEIKAVSWKVWILPSLCISLGMIFNNIAINCTAATTAAFLRSLSTIMTPILAFLIYKKRLKKSECIVYVIAVAGLYLLCGRGGLSSFGWGEVFSLLSALLCAGSLIFGEESLKQMSAGSLTTIQAGFSLILSLLFAFSQDHGLYFATANTNVWLIIFYMAVACTLVGVLLQNIAMEFASAKLIALLQCACPVLTALFAFVILGEKLSFAGIIGATLIILSLVIEIIFE